MPRRRSKSSSSVVAPSSLADSLIDPLQNQVGNLQVVLVLHDQMAAAANAALEELDDWCPPFAGYFLYYPSRRQQPAALSALIETLRA